VFNAFLIGEPILLREYVRADLDNYSLVVETHLAFINGQIYGKNVTMAGILQAPGRVEPGKKRTDELFVNF